MSIAFDPYDDQIILHMRRAKASWEDIAQRLKTTWNDVRDRYIELREAGETAEPRGNYAKAFTREESDTILRMRTRGAGFEEIAATLPGRTAASIRARYSKMIYGRYLPSDREEPQLSVNDAEQGSRELLRRLIATGCVYGVQMAAWNTRHGVAA